MKPTRDELEYSISQYLDGTLNAVSQATLEEILASDAEARALLSEYQRLDIAVKSSLPLPEMDWNKLTRNISRETEKIDAPVRHFRLSPVWSKAIALAATVGIVIGIFAIVRPGRISSPTSGTGAVAVNPAPIDVQIGGPAAVASAPVSEISIGQPSGLVSTDYSSSEAVVSSPSTYWIASGDGSAQDNEPTLY